MKQILSLLFAFFALTASAQTATAVLDKTAALCSGKAVQVKFSSKGQGASSGTIVIQNKMFTIQSGQASVWFDGKTEWSLVAGSDEVNVTEPTAKEIATMNPMNFVYLYRAGYKSSLKTTGNQHEVHLTATDGGKSIKEAYVYVDKSSYKPRSVKFRTGAKDWTTVTISSFQVIGKKSKGFFQFNRSAHPNVQVIDLR